VIAIVDSGININPDSCRCRSSPETCLQVVIELRPPSKSSFRLGKISESLAKKNPQPWDLSILGLPRHPLHGERVKWMNVTYLSLIFATLEEKKNFVSAFNTISRLRDLDEEDYQKARARFARRSNQPNSPEAGKKISIPVSIPPTPSKAPRIGSISLGDDLQDSVAYLTDKRRGS
jgi:hypothetical protein